MKSRTNQAHFLGRVLFYLMLVACLSWGGTAFAQNSTIFGPNVYVYNTSYSAATINATLATLAGNAQFSTNRYAVFFAPGTYSGVESQVGYYMSVAGLGEEPTATAITNGYLTSNTTDSNGNLTTNFWRSLENMEMSLPSGDIEQWGVSQGADFRRMDINAAVELTNSACGEASGGFIADSVITGDIESCSQQQWYTRNSNFAGWTGNLWNMTFSGDNGAPAAAWGGGGNNYCVLSTTPVVREKPFLYVDSSGNYWVFSPTLRTSSVGPSWTSSSPGPGNSLAISTFLIATPSTSLATINAALASGKNLILTPGIYPYSGSINVTNANTVVLGMGYADLVPQSGTAALTVADVGGVQLAGFLIDAGPVNSPVLLQIGVKGAPRNDWASNPTSISDVNFRIGGATAGTATEATEIDSDNVIIDNMWSWRADHGADASWTGNVAMNGLVVNGDNVTALGLAVEHYEKEQVVWNGEGGETIFYQSEMPYDVPSQAAWMNGSVDGYASYNVAPTVATHQAYGIGVYSYFDQGVVIMANSGIAAPVADGVKVTDSVSVYLAGDGGILYTDASNNDTVDNAGTEAHSGSYISFVTDWGGTNGNCGSAPGTPGTPSGSGTSSSTINVTWGASSEGSDCMLSYNLFRSTTSGFAPSASNQIASDLTSASFADSGLATGTTYYYIVQAVDADGASAKSAQGSGATTGGASCTAVPSAPTSVATSGATSSSLNVSWTGVTPPANCSIGSYNVYSSKTSGFTPGTTNLIANVPTGTTYTNTGLAASTTYYYVVESVDADGSSPASAQGSGTTLASGSGGDFIAINFEGPAVGNSGGGDAPFAADEDFSGGGKATPTTATISTTAAGANAAPMAVYQTQRDGTFTYTIPGMVAGSQHTVLIHFAEIYFTAAGDREYNVAINGTPVLTNFDQFAAAGGKDIAVVKTFTATANSSGQIVIAYTSGAVNQPSAAGLEIR